MVDPGQILSRIIGSKVFLSHLSTVVIKNSLVS